MTLEPHAHYGHSHRSPVVSRACSAVGTGGYGGAREAGSRSELVRRSQRKYYQWLPAIRGSASVSMRIGDSLAGDVLIIHTIYLTTTWFRAREEGYQMATEHIAADGCRRDRRPGQGTRC